MSGGTEPCDTNSSPVRYGTATRPPPAHYYSGLTSNVQSANCSYIGGMGSTGVCTAYQLPSGEAVLVNPNTVEWMHQRYSIEDYRKGAALTDKQRLELYELRNSAIREIEECENANREPDMYLKRYIKSIDDILRKN